MFNHAIGLLMQPSHQWRQVAQLPDKTLTTMILYPCIMALIPAVAWYYGTTEVGWTVGGGRHAGSGIGVMVPTGLLRSLCRCDIAGLRFDLSATGFIDRMEN